MAGPLFLKQAVDVLSSGAADALAAAVTAVVTFGLCGVVQHLSKELQHPTFTPVSQVHTGGSGLPGHGVGVCFEGEEGQRCCRTPSGAC
jgi:hypothetical protein